MLHVASAKNFRDLSKLLYGKTVWIPVLSDRTKHYRENRVSYIYVYSMETEDEFIFGFHALDLESIDIVEFLSGVPDGTRIVHNAKYLSTFNFRCDDMDMLIWYHTGHPVNVEHPSAKIFGLYSSWYPSIGAINDVLPIMRVLEYFRDIRDTFLQYYTEPVDSGYSFYDTVYRRVLTELESSGVCIDLDVYTEQYGDRISSNIVYTTYNPYTATGRPSNVWGRKNLNSLNKEDGSRRIIVSRHPDGRLVEFDYDSYHIRLIANLIGFTLPDGNLHEYFARQYFKTSEVTPELYDKSKRLTFRQIYGTVMPEYEHIPFYAKLREYCDRIYVDVLNTGAFRSPLSGRVFQTSWMTDVTMPKVLSYIIQCFETELNIMVLDRILTYLYDMKSSVIMYTYDAILVDYNPVDGSEVLKGISSIMSCFGYPVKVSVGLNYHDMVKVTI